MKKKLNILFVVMLCLGLLAGCQEKVSEQEGTKTADTNVTAEAEDSQKATSETDKLTEGTLEAETTGQTPEETLEAPKQEAPEETLEAEENKVTDAYLDCGGQADDTYLCSLIYLGSTIDMPLEDYCEKYNSFSWIQNAEICTVNGEDAYLLIPKYEGTVITVQPYEATEDKKQEAVLTTESPLLLECNTSDIQSNSWITLDTPEGKCEFTPFISLRDGMVEAADTVFVQMWDGSSN